MHVQSFRAAIVRERALFLAIAIAIGFFIAGEKPIPKATAMTAW